MQLSIMKCDVMAGVHSSASSIELSIAIGGGGGVDSVQNVHAMEYSNNARTT